jgi:hypothetical protein
MLHIVTFHYIEPPNAVIQSFIKIMFIYLYFVAVVLIMTFGTWFSLPYCVTGRYVN